MTTAMDKTLNSLERTELRQAERTIEAGMATFFEVGQALYDIREKRLYREGHKTFEAYCKERWEFSASRARQLIASAETVAELKSVTTGNTFPTNERQVRPLLELPEEERKAAWEDAVQKAGGVVPTAKQVEEVVEEFKADDEPYQEQAEEQAEPEPEPDPEIFDAKKRPVPDKLRDIFSLRPEYLEVRKSLASAVTKLGEIGAANPYLDLTTARRDLENAKQAVKFSTPYAPCPYCKRGCEACKETGWVNETVWRSAPASKRGEV